jgi:NAD(P)-dependent dehydrogenase (short-subunit alcohol dehydrogenase family)
MAKSPLEQRNREKLMSPIDQQVILITGSTDGHGRRLAIDLAERGATVLLHGRDQRRGEQALKEVVAQGEDRPHRVYLADLSSRDEVRRLGREVEAEHDRLDALVNNAGIGAGRLGVARELSREGYELRFQVNYLAGYLLTALLLPLLRRSAPARVVNVSSAGQAPIDFGDVMLEHGYDGWRAYQQSKLAQIMFTFELAERLEGSGVTVNALHPATFMDTKMVREVASPMSSVEAGAEATLRLVAAAELEGITGRYFDRVREVRAQAQAYDPSARQQVWELSEELCGLEAFADPFHT